MVKFIDDHRDAYGVEPIGAVLPIAPSTYYTHQARAADPCRAPLRIQLDAALRPQIQRVWDENFQVYGGGLRVKLWERRCRMLKQP